MTQLQKEIDRVFSYISSLPVSGDNVEVMAAAREGLRRAYQLAGTEKKENEDG